ncbi:MAG: NUDIX domain-containing protein, partial [Chitinophagaceae bacterium]
GTVGDFPVKSKKINVRHRFFYYLMLEYRNRLLVRQRENGDVWSQLHEFILKETDEPKELEEINRSSFWGMRYAKNDWQIMDQSEPIVHVLSHQRINARIIHVRIKHPLQLKGYTWMSKEQIDQLAFPRLITRYRQSR